LSPGGKGRASNFPTILLICCLVVFLLFPGLETPVRASAAWPSDTEGSEGYPSAGSWAIGVVVPEGAKFADDGPGLSWEAVRNLTVIVRLPNISHTDGAILAVLSVMSSDDHVMQVAAGIYPNHTWQAFSWVIGDILSYPQEYEWILNCSKPRMVPGANVVLSIFLSPTNFWNLKVVDVDENTSVQQEFPADVAPTFKRGDQQVFALESYTSNFSIFEQMGNLSLRSILADGRAVSGGVYVYSGWDAVHNPLFIVGGADAPSFMSVEQSEAGEFVWRYSGRWTGSGFNPKIDVMAVAYPLLLISAALIVSAVYLRNRGLEARR